MKQILNPKHRNSVIIFSLSFFLSSVAHEIVIYSRMFTLLFSMVWRWMVSCQKWYEISLCSMLKAIVQLQKTLDRVPCGLLLWYLNGAFSPFLSMTAPDPIHFHFMTWATLLNFFFGVSGRKLVIKEYKTQYKCYISHW